MVTHGSEVRNSRGICPHCGDRILIPEKCRKVGMIFPCEHCRGDVAVTTTEVTDHCLRAVSEEEWEEVLADECET